MKFLEILKDILLASIIAILIPLILNWGIDLIYKNPKKENITRVTNYEKSKDDLSPEESKKLSEQDADKIDKEYREIYMPIVFFSSIITGMLLIIIGSLIKIHSLSIGLIGGGIFNIIVGLFYRSDFALLNFIIFLMILIILIIISVRIQKNKTII